MNVTANNDHFSIPHKASVLHNGKDYVLCEVGTEISNVMCMSFLRYILLNIFWVVNIHLKFNFFPQSQFCRFLSRSKLNSETDKKVLFLTHDDPSGSLHPFHTQYQFPRFLKQKHLSTRMTPPPLCHLTPKPIRLRYCKQQTRSFSFLSSIFLYHILYSCSSFASFLFLRKSLPPPPPFLYFSAKSYLALALVLGVSSL